MGSVSYVELIGFGTDGWGFLLAKASVMTLFVATIGFLAGSVVGAFLAFFRLSGKPIASALAITYTTVFRGIPELLIIYLFYFGAADAVRRLVELWVGGSFQPPAFAIGVAAIAAISGAYQAEVFRGGYAAISKGEIEAGLAAGFSRTKLFRLVVCPQVLRYSLPSLGNVWQIALKDSSLISVIGLVELLRQTGIAAGSTRRPFDFYATCAALFFLMAWFSSICFRRAEKRLHLSVRKT